MATPIYYTGDTWPPITGTCKDADGVAVDLSGSDSLRFVAKISGSATVIDGTAAFCDSDNGGAGDGTDGKWMYTWASDDLSTAGSYIPEIEVTWDEESTPVKIETFRTDSQTFTVAADND